MNTTPAIQTAHLTKFYGARRGIEDVSFEVERGEVFGLLGPNGAGKTTTIRILLGFMRPSKGSARVLGYDSRRGNKGIRRRTGYLPSDFTIYEGMDAGEIIEYFSSLRRRPATRAVELCERLQLDPGRRVGDLSRGNRQKVGLVLAFMTEPDLLILDEPTTGLDPLIQQEFNQIVEETRDRGSAVFLSSHVLSEVETLCNRVGIIREGCLVAVEEISALKARIPRRVEVRFAETVSPESLARVSGVRDLVVRDNRLTGTVTGPIEPLLKAVLRYRVRDLITHQPTLEEVFLAYYSTETDKDPEPEHAAA